MATATHPAHDTVRERIRELRQGTLSPVDVDIDEVEGRYGDSVEITVSLSSSTRGAWNPRDFLEIRRYARAIAQEEYGRFGEVSLVYTSADEGDAEAAEPEYSSDKNAQEAI